MIFYRKGVRSVDSKTGTIFVTGGFDYVTALVGAEKMYNLEGPINSAVFPGLQVRGIMVNKMFKNQRKAKKASFYKALCMRSVVT